MDTVNFRNDILGLFEGKKPKKVPFFSFSGLFARGSFEREMRNRGMGLIIQSSPLIEIMPNVSVTRKNTSVVEEVISHTPMGDISYEAYTGTDRIDSTDFGIKKSFSFKSVDDYDPIMSMIKDTVISDNQKEHRLKDLELGDDGIIRLEGLIPPYTGAQLIMGLEKWSYEQYDNPERFMELLKVLDSKGEKAARMLADIDLNMIIVISDITDNIGAVGYIKYELPFCKKLFNILRASGNKCGVHAHATLLKRQKEFLKELSPDFIESYTPPPYSDLSLPELRETVGEEVVILMNFPETIFYSGYDKTKQYTVQLLKSDHNFRKAIGFSEMGMMGINEKIKDIFETGFRAVVDAIDEVSY